MNKPIKQRDPMHPWYPHEDLFPQPIRFASNKVAIICLVTVGLLGTISIVLMMIYKGTSLTSHFPQLLVVIPLLLAFGGISFVFWSWKVRARRNMYALCLQCGQFIGNLGEKGTCPKCNRAFVLEQTQWSWRRICGLPESMIPPGFPEGTPPAGPAFGGMPRPVRNFLVVCYGILIFAAILISELITWVLPYLDPPDTVDRSWSMLSTWFKYLLLGLVLLAFFVHLRRWRKKAQRLDYHLCVHCAYSLHGLSESGNCPECGSEYTFQGCEIVWKKFCNQQLQLPKNR